MLTLRSPAKINLFLKIVKRRSDGYHELASLFQAIDLHDTLHFSLSEKDHLTCTNPSIPTDHRNLVLKATQLFRQKTGLSTGLTVHLEKRIPHEAGLGGGSSNAATTLWALNQLHGSPVSIKELTEWSAEIGSDISFFFSEGTAYCTGRGEKLEAVATLPKSNLWIVKPQQGLSTPQVFKQLDLAQLAKHDPQTVLASFFTETPIYFNDLENPAFALMPQLQTLKSSLLDSGFHTVLMSGSGSAFFCLGNGSTHGLKDVFASHCAFVNRSKDGWY